MKYYHVTETEVVLWKRRDVGWRVVATYPNKQAALRGMVAYNLWCEFRNNQSSWYSPWARENADGGDVSFFDRWYPVLDTEETVLEPSPAADYALEVRTSMDDVTMNLEEMSYMANDFGIRNIAALELMIDS